VRFDHATSEFNADFKLSIINKKEGKLPIVD